MIPPTPLESDPKLPNLSRADALESILLRLDDEEWKTFVLNNGDAIEDEDLQSREDEEWFEEFAERQRLRADTEEQSARAS